MQGSLYPDGVLIDHNALRRTETSKAAEILRNRLDWTSRGVYTGGEVTVNGIDTTRIDVAELSGFVPTGESIETTSDYYSILLDDYTASAVNYVVAIYTETNTNRQPHETNGNSYATAAQAAWRIRVYEESRFLALPASDENLGNDARDRCLLLAKVTANGVGVPLTASNIFSPTVFNDLLYATPKVPVTISGVTIISVSSDSTPGTGVLDYEFIAPATYKLRWNPVGSAWGVGVGWETFTLDEIRDLPGPAGTSIRVSVALPLMSTVVGTVSENIVITNLYYQEIPRLTAEDSLHRHMIGSGIVSPINPHGLSIEDITGDSLSYLDEHQDVMHANGIWRGSSANALLCTVNTATVTQDSINIMAPGTSDFYYVNGKKLSTADISNLNVFTAGAGTKFYQIYVSDEGSIEYNLKASYPIPRTVTGTWIVGMSRDTAPGVCLLKHNDTGAAHTFQWDNGPIVSLLYAEPDQVIRLFSYTGTSWVDLWVNMSPSGNPDADLPAILTQDAITITADPDWDLNMPLADVCYWWDAAGPRGRLGYDPLSASRRPIDTRPWGTLGAENISDDALRALVYNPVEELHLSGVLLGRGQHGMEFELIQTGAPSLTGEMSGGSAYIRGKRVDCDFKTFVFVNNAVSLVYLDLNGVVQTINVTADFAGNVENAAEWVLGSFTDVPAIDSVTHATDPVDPPTRGVLLWEVTTAAGNITRIEDLRRNVNGAVDPWTVGSRASAVAYPLCALPSLYAAFLYANVATNTLPRTSLDIRVKIGGVVRLNRVVTQPRNVAVVGLRDAAGGNYFTIQVDVADLDGVWTLSNGSKVEGVTVRSNIADTTLFKLHTGVSIKECFFVLDQVGNWLAKPAEVASHNVVISNNRCTLGEGVLIDVGAATGFSGFSWEITGNTFAIDDVSLVHSCMLTLRNHSDTVVSGNTFTLNSVSVGSFFGMISVRMNDPADATTSSNNVWIRDNGFQISGASANIDYCVYIDGLAGGGVSGNTISGTAGTTNLVGIYVTNVQGVEISSNKIFYVGVGIYLTGNFTAPSLIYRDCKIVNNSIASGSHMGIYAQVTGDNGATVAGLDICGNTIYSFDKEDPAGSTFGDSLYGIFVELLSGVAALEMVNINVCNNAVWNLDCTTFVGGEDVGGVVVQLNAGAGSSVFAKNLKVDGNQVSEIVGNDGYVTSGILVKSVDIGTMVAFESSICGNQVSFVPVTVDPASEVYGIGLDSQAYYYNICNNSVAISNAGALTAWGVAIWLSTANAQYGVVSGNTVSANWYGIKDVSGGYTNMVGNDITSSSVGIFVDGSGGNSSVTGNTILVNTENTNDTGVFANGAFGIIGGTRNDILCEGNKVTLAGRTADSLILEDSANIAFYGTTGARVIGCVTSQSHLGVVGAGSAWHIRLLDTEGISCIKDCVVDNSSNVPAPSNVNGISSALVAAGGWTRVISVMGNTVYGSNNNAFGTGVEFQVVVVGVNGKSFISSNAIYEMSGAINLPNINVTAVGGGVHTNLTNLVMNQSVSFNPEPLLF